DLVPGGTLIVNEDTFETRNLDKAGYAANPLDDGSLDAYQVFRVPMTTLTLEATKELGVKPRDAERSKNFFALGLLTWMYTRPLEPTLEWIEAKFGKKPEVRDANVAALKAGYNFGETAELFDHPFEVRPAKLPPGRYRNITGNQALALGLVAASQQSGLPLFLGSYPITPASDILQILAGYKEFGVKVIQAEDEIAAAGMALGAAYGGCLGVTTTSGPGLDLKSETVGLAISLELPLIVVDVQRGGPSTGLPTKTEQSDLLHAMYGRHGESPLPIVAAQSPSDCFAAAVEAARLALKYRTPVILLTDGYLANGAEPWRLPDLDALPDLGIDFATAPNGVDADGNPAFFPYQRDPDTLARPLALPGTPGLEHRIGGLEKADVTGNVSYDPANHERMTHLRAAKVAGIARDIPEPELDEQDGARILLLGWGSTWGPIKAAVRRLRARGRSVSRCHLRHLNPFPSSLGEILSRYEFVLVPEMNSGQLSRLVRAEFLVDAQVLSKVQGLPFRSAEIEHRVLEVLGDTDAYEGAEYVPEQERTA
ncbi:MAG TPA: 2-oxoacid:acceptor oxidoreductase subunit alpha, partial [Acidimicrobiia bacterium]|nr:2-oxoacid:acceptor oxidoreductase subunit alpha [Acidimicrobiia bacterium]